MTVTETQETCPACGAAASGRFCNQCGGAITAACAACGNPLPKGARFCNQCGTAVGAAPAAARRPSPLPWIVAAAAVVALGGVLLFRAGEEEAPAPFAPAPGAEVAAPGAGAAPGGGAASVDLASMTPREAADRLFNRVMTAAAGGDSAQARQFLPMALAAYGRVSPLDDDGRYHVATLHLVGGDWAAARAQSDTILAGSPRHLFALFTAAKAEEGRGNRAGAQALYRRFMEAYRTEAGRGDIPEYRDHAQALPAIRQEAERAVAAAR
ncbi:MAG TPA: zinc-ribbon domain-containing protein [Longimicrobium sp.]|nr:zinc-ribbon domain-containing protein [Longimicrobium sp.]